MTVFIMLYEYNHMSFRLFKSPKTFQRLMQKILVDLYDIIIFFKSFCEEHLKRLSLVLKKFTDHGLKTQPDKCRCFHSSVHDIGHIISADGIFKFSFPSKVKDVHHSPILSNVRELRAILGLASYYRCYICGFTQTAYPSITLQEQLDTLIDLIEGNPRAPPGINHHAWN